MSHGESRRTLILRLLSYADYYIQTKREEWRRYHNSVSQWETDNYLGVY